MFRVISGKLIYLKMVKGGEDSTYQKLAQRFNKISGFNTDEILQDWEQQGINAPEQLFKKQQKQKFISVKDFLRIGNLSPTQKDKMN